MNVIKYNPNNKNCATCKYWVGDRDLTTNQKFVITKPDNKGKCYGKYNQQVKLARETGSCWKIWYLINENDISKLIADVKDIIKTENTQRLL